MNNDSIDENHHQQQQVEQHRQVAADNDEEEEEEEEEDDAIDAVFVKLNTIIERRKQFPLRQRNRIVELAEEYIESLGNDIHDMLCDQNHCENYRGLDSTRDTDAEVETALRFFPDLLSKRKDVSWCLNRRRSPREYEWIHAADGEGDYPIQCLSYIAVPTSPTPTICNLKAMPFIAGIAQLGIELKKFREVERGGLLCKNPYGHSTINRLAYNYYHSDDEEQSQQQSQLDDTVCLALLIRLRQVNLLKIEDIDDHDLFRSLCVQRYSAERRLSFFVEWDPTVLIQVNNFGWLPLHSVALNWTIQSFRVLFEYMIRYYPNKKGVSLLFRKNNLSDTPFEIAGRRHGIDKVTKIVEITLNNSDMPIHTVEALFLSATEERIRLDCVYLLLRREPDVLVSGFTNNNNYVSGGNDDGGDGDNGGDDNDGDGVENYASRNNDDDDDDDDNYNNNDWESSNDLSVDTIANADMNYRKRKRDS